MYLFIYPFIYCSVWGGFFCFFLVFFAKRAEGAASRHEFVSMCVIQSLQNASALSVFHPLSYFSMAVCNNYPLNGAANP